MDQGDPNAPPHDERTEHRLILASRVLKTHVYNRDGEHVGHIDDLSVERATGQVQYAILSFGGFLGIGEKYHPLPWAALEYDSGKGGFVVSLDRAALDNAPTYDRTELEGLGGESHQRHSDLIYEYYGRYGFFPY